MATLVGPRGARAIAAASASTASPAQRGRRRPARGGPARGVRAAGRGDLRGLPAALRHPARGALRPRRTSACWPATSCMRSGWPAGRARRHRGGGRAGRHDHAQRARAGRRRAGAGRRGVGRRRARGRLGIERRAQRTPRTRLRGRPRGDRGDAHKRGGPRRRRPESRLDIVGVGVQTSTHSTSPSTRSTGRSPAPSRARRSPGGGS